MSTEENLINTQDTPESVPIVAPAAGETDENEDTIIMTTNATPTQPPEKKDDPKQKEKEAKKSNIDIKVTKKYDVAGNLVDATDDPIIDVNEDSVAPLEASASLEPEFTSGLTNSG